MPPDMFSGLARGCISVMVFRHAGKKEEEMIELIRKRRSIRRFTKEPVDRKSLDLLVEALLRAPSSRNINPWEFVIVDAPQLLEKLSAAKTSGSTFLKGAPLGIVICADSSKSDVWVEDCSIASILLQMTALSLGLGSCWIQIRNRQHNKEMTSECYIREALGLGDHLAVLAMVAIGHPDESRAPLGAEKLEWHKVRLNGYTEPYPAP
jgi:nitroreductase